MSMYFRSKGILLMKTIIAGSRDFNNYNLLCESLKSINITEVVSGGARGADMLGEQYAKDNNLDLKIFNAQWSLYGNRAGILRNEQMANYADQLVAFWNGYSSGTAHMVQYAKKKNLKVKVIMYED